PPVPGDLVIIDRPPRLTFQNEIEPRGLVEQALALEMRDSLVPVGGATGKERQFHGSSAYSNITSKYCGRSDRIRRLVLQLYRRTIVLSTSQRRAERPSAARCSE